MASVIAYVFEKETHALVGAYEKFDVLRVTQCYDAHGKIEIQAPATVAYRPLQPERILWLGPGSPAYFLEEVEIAPQKDRGDVLTATGWTVSRMLHRRPILTTEVMSGRAGAIMQKLVNQAFSGAGDPFPLLDIDIDASLGPEMEYESKPMQLDDALLSLLKASGLGIRSTFDLPTKRLKISLYQAADHSVGGGGKQVVFSPEYNNISEIDYIDSLNPYRSRAYVLGEEVEDEERIIETVGSAASGYDRYADVVEAGKSRKTTENGKTTTMTEEQYRAVLRQHGEEYLAKCVRAKSCDGKINTDSKLYKYGVDYALGDICTFIHSSYGVTSDLRISEIEHAYENSQRTVYAKLGDKKPTLADKIKLKL